MKKSDRILKHYADGLLSVAEIAQLVDCDPAYVRVVARQRNGRANSQAEIKYRIKRYGSIEAYRESYNATRRDQRREASRSRPDRRRREFRQLEAAE